MTEPPSQQLHAAASAAEAGDLAWHRFGDGPPLLMLHGGHGSWQHWLRHIEPLRAHRASARIELTPGTRQQGRGPSPAGRARSRLA